ncbi:MAG: membrane protein insertion efficiency factor YidD [Leptonema sp. (in: Bacteria)]|nr:membrane protein insertion efficiency factor YidD [Leptonema sp. (in: bacteria)]
MDTTHNYEPLYSQRPSFLNRVFLVLIAVYKKLVSPLLPGRCRFYPSCSAYAKESFEKLPFHKALFKSIWRILRCNPFSEGYFDPVIPESNDAAQTKEQL